MPGSICAHRVTEARECTSSRRACQPIKALNLRNSGPERLSASETAPDPAPVQSVTSSRRAARLIDSAGWHIALLRGVPPRPPSEGKE